MPPGPGVSVDVALPGRVLVGATESDLHVNTLVPVNLLFVNTSVTVGVEVVDQVLDFCYFSVPVFKKI